MQQQRALCAVTCYVLVLCTLSSNGAWVKPFQLQRTDRIGFVRPRKVASTTMMSFLTRDLGLCQSHCAPNTGVCSDCVLSFDCEPCEDLYAKYSGCKFCPHHNLRALRNVFSAQQAKLAHYGQPVGKLYTVTVIRDPVDKFLSYFFFVKESCPYNDTSLAVADAAHVPLPWLRGLPLVQQKMVCSGDIASFAPLARINNEQSGLLVNRGFRLNAVADEAMCNVSLARLHEFAAVIPYNHLGAGLVRMKQTFLLPPNVTERYHVQDVASEVAEGAHHQRPTQMDPLREQALRNTTLRNLILRYNECDQRLYQLAQKLFAEGA
eukprot:m.101976 g.101976  ORF g.101976 m.101976 type:complete len:321 (-) comp13215_c0_seq4:559-1521(-)